MMRHRKSHRRSHRILRRLVRQAMSRWLRICGWRVEGRSPSPASPCVLIVGPKAARRGRHAGQLRLALRWLRSPYFFSDAALTAENMYSEHNDGSRRPAVAIVFNTELERVDWHQAAIETQARVQVLTIEARHKRIRFHTPFHPGGHAERDLQYVKRLFSYFA